MNNFLHEHQSVFKRVFNGVKQYDQNLQALSTWWGKIALVGKINSFEVASTILEDMEATLHQFNTLQERLINSLINEQARKVILQNTARSQVAIDVLIRNLFERTADIGFLATDHDIIRFLENNDRTSDDHEFIEQRLRAYTQIYSVYKDALLIKADGELVFQLSQPTRSEYVSDPLIKQALENPDDYVEFFGKISFLDANQDNLLYANAIVGDNGVVGVIVLCFRFNNELNSITKRLLSEGEVNHFVLCNEHGKAIYAPYFKNSADSLKLNLHSAPKLINMNGQSMVEISTRGQAYQDYEGPKNWYMGSLLAAQKMEERTNESNSLQSDATSTSQFHSLISEELLDIRNKAIAINDDLQLIVLNGIVTAARSEAVEFMPVLEEIKKIGQNISGVFAQSVDSLFSTIISGKLNEIRLQANLAVDIMDRNLYERANDCRWWGLSSLIRKALSQATVDRKIIQETLATIHTLYTVYHVLYVYDEQGRYVAFSTDQYDDCIGQQIESLSGAQSVSQLKSIYEYTVSPFNTFDCYEGASTYIYNAAIRHMEIDEEIIGGIGIVFDSTVEFKAILDDILPRDNGSIKEGAKALFTTDQGTILASTSPEHAIGDYFFPKINKEQLERESALATVLSLEGDTYLMGVAKSTGYREYKRKDGYENTVLAWVLTPC